MKYLNIIAVSFLLAGCAIQSAMPMGNDMMQIDVSAAPVYGRAGAQEMAFKKAARATLDAGYDKFIVVDNAGWTENSSSAFSQHSSSGSFGGNANGFGGSASGSGSSFFNTFRNPEIKMVIKMFHYKEPGSAKAIDAHKIVEKENPE